MKTAQVNESGLAHIKAWIDSTSKTDDSGPVCGTDPQALNAWASDAEESMGNGNPPLIEMRASSTKSGRTETFVVPEDGVTWMDLNVDD